MPFRLVLLGDGGCTVGKVVLTLLLHCECWCHCLVVSDWPVYNAYLMNVRMLWALNAVQDP